MYRPLPSKFRWALASLAVFAVGVAGCSSDGGSNDDDDDQPEGFTDTWETGRWPTTGSDGGTTGDTDGDTPASGCEELSVGPSQMRRLTATEYLRTATDLLRMPVELSIPLPGDNGALGFDNQAAVQELSAADILAWESVARELGVLATQDLQSFVGCDLTGADEAACLASFIADFGRRAFRRPLSDSELATYTSFYEAQRQSEPAPQALALLVQGLLLSPKFLYLVEPGSEDAPTAIDGYAIASRLSYLLWKTMPDEALFEAAAAGELDTRDGVEAEARRMIADERVVDAVTDFYLQWAGAQGLEGLGVPEGFDPSLSDDAELEVSLFLRDWFQGGGRTSELLTSTKAFVTEDLAAFYGVGGVSGDTPVQADLDPTRHAGLLTRMAFTGTHTIPPSRGDFILGKVLCIPLSVPALEIPEPPEGEAYKTQRERFEAHAELECATACHSIMDPLGFAFEHYDNVGQWRDLDNGYAVDAATVLALPGIDEINGPVDGAVELSTTLGESEAFLRCQAEQWFTYAYSRPPTPEDDCSLEMLETAFVAADGDPRELLVQLTVSDAFRFVRKKEAMP